jgi:hypothetical protein
VNIKGGVNLSLFYGRTGGKGLVHAKSLQKLHAMSTQPSDTVGVLHVLLFPLPFFSFNNVLYLP